MRDSIVRRWAAKPTMYRGVLMRSRLEARWARFFERCGWAWEYEPLIYRGWCPDFRITGSKGSLLVEVKPTRRFLPDIAKIMEDTQTESETLLLGCDVPVQSMEQGVSGGFVIGWIGEQTDNGGVWWQDALLGTADGSHIDIDIGPNYGNYQGRLNGQYDGNSMYLNHPFKVRAAWEAAK